MSGGIHQQQLRDCGIAALATILCLTYEQVERALLKDSVTSRAGTTTRQLYRASVHLGKPLEASWLWRRRPWFFIPDHSLVKDPAPAIGSGWHWVAKIQGQCWCPIVGWCDHEIDRRFSYVSVSEERELVESP